MRLKENKSLREELRDSRILARSKERDVRCLVGRSGMRSTAPYGWRGGGGGRESGATSIHRFRLRKYIAAA